MRNARLRNILRGIRDRFFPNLRGGWAPSRRMLFDSSEAGADHDYKEVYPPAVADFSNLNFLGGDELRFASSPAPHWPSVGVNSFRDGSICFSSGSVLDSRGLSVCETSWYSGHVREFRLCRDPRKIAKEYLTGTSISLATDFAAGNYGHFLLDGLGRLAIYLKESGDLLERCDRIFVSGPETGWKRRLLGRFGLPIEKVHWLSDDMHYRCENLIVSSFPGLRRTYPGWLCDFFRDSLELPDKSPKRARRLFICRKGTTRKLTNENVLVELAQQFGFERYYPEDSSDAIADFQNADAVIGAHGAGLTDIVFMNPGSKVLELMPTDHRHCYFFTLGTSSKLDYTILLGKSEMCRSSEAWGASPYDFSVQEKELKDYLEKSFTS